MEINTAFSLGIHIITHQPPRRPNWAMRMGISTISPKSGIESKEYLNVFRPKFNSLWEFQPEDDVSIKPYSLSLSAQVASTRPGMFCLDSETDSFSDGLSPSRSRKITISQLESITPHTPTCPSSQESESESTIRPMALISFRVMDLFRTKTY